MGMEGGKGGHVYVCAVRWVVRPDHFKFASYGPAFEWHIWPWSGLVVVR